MREVNSNIWKYKLEDKWMIIATNGTVKKGKSIMRDDGISMQVDFIYNDFSAKLGGLIEKAGNIPVCLKEYKIITLPVKKSYKDKSDIELIKAGIPNLIKFIDKLELDEIYMVQPGCGDDDLDWKKEVRPVIKKLLDDRFIIAIKHKKKKVSVKEYMQKKNREVHP